MKESAPLDHQEVLSRPFGPFIQESVQRDSGWHLCITEHLHPSTSAAAQNVHFMKAHQPGNPGEEEILDSE